MSVWVICFIGIISDVQHANAMPRECSPGKHTFAPIWLDGWYPEEITSPNYPDAVNATGLNCEWKVKAQYGDSIVISFLDVHMGDSCYANQLKVVDDTPAHGEGDLKFPGMKAKCHQNDFPPAIRKVNANGDVTVKFKMDKIDNVRFKIKFATVAKEGYCNKTATLGTKCPKGSCGGKLCVVQLTPNETMVVTTPNFPNDSGPNKNCKTKYVAPIGSQIAVNFLEMDMKASEDGICAGDYVELKETANAGYGVIG